MKKIIAGIILFSSTLVYCSEAQLHAWKDETYCKIKNKDITICKIVDTKIKLVDNLIQLLTLKNKYDKNSAMKIDLKNPDDFIQQAKVSESDSKAIKLYATRASKNSQDLCEYHKKLNSNDREFLEGIKMKYQNVDIYNELEYEQNCK